MVPSPALGLHLHDRDFRLCLSYWLGLRMTDGECNAHPVGERGPQTPLGTTKLAAEGMVTASTDTMPYGMFYSLLLSPPPLPHGRKCHH